jgi:hypothetical protein
MSSPLAEAVPAALPSPAPAGGRGWLDMAEAARRSGRSVGHLTRQCRSAWLAKGLARQAKRGPGKPVWEVHETADPALAPVKFPEQIGTGPAPPQPTARARATAIERRRILVRWEEAVAAAIKLGFDRDAGTGRFLQQLLIDEGIGEALPGDALQLGALPPAMAAGGLAAWRTGGRRARPRRASRRRRRTRSWKRSSAST